MAHSSMVLDFGEACDQKLTTLIDGLRQKMKTGRLSMFKHHVAYKGIHGERNDDLQDLLDEILRDFHQLVVAAKNDESYHDLYYNASFVINDFILMEKRLNAINLRKGAGQAVTVLQNVQNNLRLYLKDLHDNGDQKHREL